MSGNNLEGAGFFFDCKILKSFSKNADDDSEKHYTSLQTYISSIYLPRLHLKRFPTLVFAARMFNVIF